MCTTEWCWLVLPLFLVLTLPFLRVNALKTNPEAAKAHLAQLGFTYVDQQQQKQQQQQKDAGENGAVPGFDNSLSLAAKTFSADPILPGLFLLPPGTINN